MKKEKQKTAAAILSDSHFLLPFAVVVVGIVLLILLH